MLNKWNVQHKTRRNISYQEDKNRRYYYNF